MPDATKTDVIQDPMRFDSILEGGWRDYNYQNYRKIASHVDFFYKISHEW